MAFYTVKMVHPQGDKFFEHVRDHVQYLIDLEKLGKVRASGQLRGTALRSGFIIFCVADRAELQALIDNDPYSIQALIVHLEIEEWVPFIGTYAAETDPIPEFARPTA
jgi:uncharacterized protein